MKKFILPVVAFLVILHQAVPVSGQWQSGSNGIFYDQGMVGIGTDANTWLTVENHHPYIGPSLNTSIAEFRRTLDHSQVRMQVYGYPDCGYVYPHVQKSVMLYATGDVGTDLILCASQKHASIRFFTVNWVDPNSERMVIDPDGMVGIAEKDPGARLHVAKGDVYISDIHHGIIMRSPDGTCWRGTMSNSGTLEFQIVDCPGGNYTGTAETAERELGMDVYPNPAHDRVTVALEGNPHGLTLTMTDLAGKIVLQKAVSGIQSILDLKGVRAGIYVLNLSGADGQQLSSVKLTRL